MFVKLLSPLDPLETSAKKLFVLFICDTCSWKNKKKLSKTPEYFRFKIWKKTNTHAFKLKIQFNN